MRKGSTVKHPEKTPCRQDLYSLPEGHIPRITVQRFIHNVLLASCPEATGAGVRRPTKPRGRLRRPAQMLPIASCPESCCLIATPRWCCVLARVMVPGPDLAHHSPHAHRSTPPPPRSVPFRSLPSRVSRPARALTRRLMSAPRYKLRQVNNSVWCGAARAGAAVEGGRVG